MNTCHPCHPLVEATPSGLNIYELIGFSTFNNNLPGVIALVFQQKSSVAGFSITKQASLLTVSWPNLVRVTGPSAQFIVSNNALLNSVSAPVLEATSLDLLVNNNPVLTSLQFPRLVTTGGRLDGDLNTTLKDVSIPMYLPANGKIVSFVGCALSQASVDHILARCVASAAFISGTVDLSSGTSSAPSAVGAASKATLIARGVTVQTN